MAGRLSFEAVAGVGTEASDMASSDSAELQEIVNLAYALTELADGRLKINFFHGGKDGSIYGRYQNGRIDINADRVDANGANLIRITLSHELTHFIQDRSPRQYERLKSFMLDRLMDEQNLTLEELIEEKQAREPGLGYEGAIDEIVADGCEEMLLDPSIVEELAQKERSLARDIVDWLRGVLERLVNSITGTHKEAVAMRQYAEQLREIWGQGLAEALASEETQNNKNTAEDGGAKWSKAETNTSKIRSDMTDEERYEALKNKRIRLVAHTNNEKLSEAGKKYSAESINVLRITEKKQLFKKLGEEFGVFKSYENTDVEMSFTFSKGNMSESTVKQQKNYELFARLFSCFDDVISSAVGIEVHNRNAQGYKQDPTLNNVYVLLGAFADGDSVVPVKLEIKDFVDKENTLYVAVALDSIKKDEVVKQGNTRKGVTQYSHSSEIRIADIFRYVKADSRFAKYIPEKFYAEKGQFSRADVSPEELQKKLRESERARRKAEKLKANAVERAEYWRNQARVRPEKRMKAEDVKRFARDILWEYRYSSVEVDELYRRLLILARHFTAGGKNNMSDLYDEAYNIAQSIIESSYAKLNENGEIVPATGKNDKATEVNE